MKKIIAAMTALASACTLMTGCGMIGSSSSSDKASSAEDSYEEEFRDFLEALDENDYDTALKYMYPDKISDYLTDNGFSELYVEESTGEHKKKTVKEIIEEEKLDEEAINEIGSAITVMDEYVDVAKKYGLGPDKDIDDLSEEEQAEITEKMEALDSVEDVESVYDITVAYDVTVVYEGEDEDEESFYAYFIDGEGWKFERSMRNYIKKSKKMSANSTASTLMKAISTAQIDLDEQGINVYGTYIISSDKSKNKDVPSDIDIDKLDSQIKKYFEDVDEIDYFCLVTDGYAGYVVVDHNDQIGTYPANSILEKSSSGKPDIYSDSRTMTKAEEKYSFDQLYDIIVDYMK